MIWKMVAIVMLIYPQTGKAVSTQAVYPDAFVTKEACEKMLVRKYLTIDRDIEVIKKRAKLDDVLVVNRKIECRQQ